MKGVGMRSRLGTIALVCVAVLVAAACDDGGDGGENGGDGTAECTWVIGTMGALSGDFAQLGVGIFRGVELAVTQAQEAGDLACDVELEDEDSQGDPEQAPALAQGLVENEELVACVCPYFSGETLATGDIFKQAGVLMTGTGTNDTIDEQGFDTWFRSVASDGVQAPTAATYITEVIDPETVAVVHDNQDYSKGLAEDVLKDLGDLAEGPFIIDPEEADYSAVVAEVSDVDPDAVYYGGYVPQAPQLLKQLREAGVDAQFISDDGAKDPSFGELAGQDAEGALVTCPCVDPLKLDAAQEFVDAYREEYNEAPRTFAADMYDVTNHVLDALAELGGDEPIEEVRQAVIEYFDTGEGLEGVAKTYTWEDSGELEADPLEDIWIYEWSDAEGDFVSLGPAGELVQ